MSGPSALLFLAEGNVEAGRSWSGSSRSLVNAIRAAGCTVTTVDVAPTGASKWLGMALAVRPSRQRWAARYHVSRLVWSLQSSRARAAIQHTAPGVPVLQIGATFEVGPQHGRGIFVYADANAALAARGRPYSEMAKVTDRELAMIVARERRAYHQATAIFTFSEMCRQSFISDFGVPHNKVLTVYGGSNLEVAPAEADVVQERSGPPTILFIGRAFERKGGRDLLEAFALVRERMPGVRLRIGGGFADVPADSGVEVLGYIDRRRTGSGSLHELYRQADVFCMPSRYEPFGVVFVEAMLHAVPCIGVRAWAMPEIIDHEQTGWLTAAGDVPALAQTLTEALADRSRLRQMGLRARRVALQRFTWEGTAAAILSVVGGQVGSHPGDSP